MIISIIPGHLVGVIETSAISDGVTYDTTVVTNRSLVWMLKPASVLSVVGPVAVVTMFLLIIVGVVII